MKNKRFVYRMSNLVITLSIVIVLVLLNVFVRDANWKIDFTQSKQFTLTKETKDYIKTIDREIKLIVLDTKAQSQMLNYFRPNIERVKKIAKLYDKVNPKIKVEIIDADKDPRIIRKYMEKDRTIYYGSVIVDDGKNWEIINVNSMFYKKDQDSDEIVKVESKITNIINKVYLGKMSTIYVLGGHGEITGNANFTTVVKAYLNDITYDVKEINLMAEGIPDDAVSVAIMDPEKDINEKEKKEIQEYLKKGGSLILMLSPSVIDREPYNNIREIVKEYNLSLDDNIVCEGKGNYKDAPPCIFTKVAKSELTENIYNNGMYVYMAGARSISVIDEENKDVSIVPILRTSDESWGDVDFDNVMNPVKDETDKKGPLNVAVIAAKKEEGEDSYSKVMIYGNSNFMLSGEDGDMSLGGLKLFTESMKWLAKEEAEIVNVQPRIVKPILYKTSEENSKRLKIAAFAVPALCAVASVFVFVKRKD